MARKQGELKTVVVQKDKLLEILTKNKEEHLQIFTDALEKWRERIVQTCDEMADKARNGRVFDPFALQRIPRPENHVKDYDRQITMYQMSVDPNVELTESELAMYVMDDWGWQREFLTTSNRLTGGAHVMAMGKYQHYYGDDLELDSELSSAAI